MARQKPESLRTTINHLYRVKNLNNGDELFGKEFYYFGATMMAKNMLGQEGEPFSYDRYGFHLRPKLELQYDEALNEKKPRITSYEPVWEFKWDKEEAKNLLASSYLPCEQFYVGKCGKREPIDEGGRHYQIFCLEDFLEGTFDELMSLGKFGISYEHPSHQLVPAALRQERENRETGQ